MPTKQDSNLTSLSIAEELSPKVLPVTPVWYLFEPNGYSDFGGDIKTISRNPINPLRQMQKGSVVDLEAAGGFGTDLVLGQLTRLLQGFFFADARQKPSTQPYNGTQVPITSATATTFTAAAGLGSFAAGDLILASGFSTPANNGLKLLSAATATVLTTTGLVAEASPPAAAKVERVGFQFGSGEVDITISGGLPRLTRASGTKDFTTFGLIPGEWVFVGGDLTAEKFTTAGNTGFARVRSIAATYIEFDKTSLAMSAETGTGKTIRLWFGTALRNEDTVAAIKARTYQLERQLGNDGNGIMSEYVIGASANELSIKLPTADKVSVDLGFIGLDSEKRTGTQGIKGGTRATLFTGGAVNTTSDFSRIKLAAVSTTDSAPTPLAGFYADVELTLKNGIKPLKAIGVLGGFATMAGNFEVEGKLNAYFSDIAAVQAVRDNADITLDMAMVKSNRGMLLDIPLLSLGDGRLDVQQDEPIMLPLTQMAAQSTFGHTLLMMDFPYLPNAADL